MWLAYVHLFIAAPRDRTVVDKTVFGFAKTMLMNLALPLRSLRWVIPASLAVACSSDCVSYPCPLPEAAEISVTASSTTAAIPGVTLAVTGAVLATGPCQPGPDGTSVCHVLGGPGSYQAELSAPGYHTATVKFTVTGTTAGCNTCGHVDRQLLSVVLQPGTDEAGNAAEASRTATSSER